MRQRKKNNTIKKFNSKMQGDLFLVFCVVVLLFLALIGRLLYITYSSGERYERRVLSQQTYVSNAIPFQRGMILDRNGTVLAKSIRVYNVILDPKKLLSSEEFYQPTIAALKECFSMKEEDVKAVLEEKPESQYVVMQKSVEAEKVEQFKKMKETDENIQGIWFEDNYKRYYPQKSLACDVIGFASANGFIGVEAYYNNELIGNNGREYGYFDADLNLERTVKPAVNGNTVVTTLDSNIQQIVEEKIEDFNKEVGGKNTAVLVMNPTNGEILAMSSGLQYDLNNPRDLSSFYTKAELNGMTEDEKMDALNGIWRNFVVSDGYEPGSTFKPITVAAALEENIVTPESTFLCTGHEVISGVSISCAKVQGHGTITLAESLMYSCNAAMMQISAKLGNKAFYQYENNFLFGQKTGIDLPAEHMGEIYQLDGMRPTDLAVSSFGQGMKVTMLQIASGISSLINGGNYYEPHVLKQIETDTGAVVETKEPVLVRETVSSETSEFIREALFQTVENGTATAAQVEGYQIGGKTGTAEKYPRKQGNYLVSFIGFAPYDNPSVLVYVVVDEPAVEDQAHSTYASNLFHNIMTEILPFLEIYKTNVTETTEPSEEPTQTEENRAEATPVPTLSPTEGENVEEDNPEGYEEESMPDNVVKSIRESEEPVE
ncbi:peptidoglycan D,D-transpeptidase FtsI family protein [Anaeromicropila populeti]|uniref:Stage V sporulation protein D (Sporulation-specific penicillin-binding protein) n=1 Tax=Anaeromicropila populeti TaxID=37658 RepID=A0A1I6KWU7_9FIRM|nr:penicillin-binding transpeptidase domain-containing protein [Anaeromicropila populeti]SFR95696.1 stage V sporulation protein D (sporulation-specific penicillin-binding protein) [Anaeromicropila populeti]